MLPNSLRSSPRSSPLRSPPPALRRDALRALAAAGLTPEDLVYADDVAAPMATLAAAGRARVFLTDHNVLAGHQAGFAAAVEGIVDHHKDEGAYVDTLAYKNVDGYGSACTQVGEILRDAGGGDPVVAAIAEDPVVSCMGGGGE